MPVTIYDHTRRLPAQANVPDLMEIITELLAHAAERLPATQLDEFFAALSGGSITPNARQYWQGKAREWLEMLTEEA